MASEEQKGPADKRFDESALQEFDPKRREFLRRLLVGAVFVPPLVSSFSIDRLLISPARADTGTVGTKLCFTSAGASVSVPENQPCPPGFYP